MRMAWDDPSAIHQLQLDGKTLLSNQNNTKGAVPKQVSFFKDLSKPTVLQVAIPKDEPMPQINFTFLKMGLPTHLIENYQPRNSNMMPTAHWYSNTTIWQLAVNPDTLNQ